MTLDDLYALSELRAGIPLPTDETTARIRRRVEHGRRPRRRRGALVAVAAAALVAAGGTIAAVEVTPWWQSGSPPVDPEAVALVARDNLPADVRVSEARTVAESGDAALVAVPLDQSGYCLIPTLDGNGSLGAQCEYQVADPASGDDDRTESVAARSAWLVYGRITDPRAASIDLGPLTVPLGTGGFFLAEVPKADWTSLDGTANPGRILASDGSTLRSGCVNWGSAPAARGAGSDVLLFSNGSGPCRPQSFVPPEPELAHARKVVELTLSASVSVFAAGDTVAIWVAPSSTDGFCDYVSWADPASHPTPGGDAMPGGGACGTTDPPRSSPGHPFTDVSMDVSGGGLVQGYVAPSSGISRVVLTSAKGATTLPFAGGWFLGQLPPGAVAGHLPEGGPFALVGYDAAGREVTRFDLDAMHDQATPH